MNEGPAARAALVGVVLAGAVAHCSRRDTPPSPTAREAPPVLEKPPTTSPKIALNNLNADIADRERRAGNGDLTSERELVDRYAMRARFEGRVSDLLAADKASAHVVSMSPNDAAGHLARAGALSGIHEFVLADAELDVATRLGAPAPDVQRARAAILLAVGREDEAATALGRPMDGSPVGDFVMAGGIEARLGHAAASEHFFQVARTRYRDVSPFTVAWIDFEHARALELRGETPSARVYLQEAATVLPSYAHAVVHLAALEPVERALDRLRPLEATSDDPDVLAAEADALRRGGRAADAAAMTARAQARFDEVLVALPKAYADHAASFFLGMGNDAPRALQLARANAAARPTSEAVDLWLTAAQAVRAQEDICAASAKALGLLHATPELREWAAKAAKACP